MAAVSAVQIFAFLVLSAAVNAGQVPSCQQQIYSIIQASVNISLFTPTCLHQTIPQLNTDPAVALLLGGSGSCIDNINALQTIVTHLSAYLNSNNLICGANLNSLALLTGDIELNLLGILGLDIQLPNINVVGLSDLSANVSLVSLSPSVLRVDVFVPLDIQAQVRTRILVLGLISLSLDLAVSIQASARIPIYVSIGAGGAVTINVGTSVCEVHDYDYPLSGLTNILNLGSALSIVATVVTGLTNAVGVVLGNIIGGLIGGCLGCVTC